ncbi:hypothetical protein BaRGS_00021424, partial [Batillaria attramentaria]
MADWPIRQYKPTKLDSKIKIDPQSFKIDPYKSKVKSWELKPVKPYEAKVPKNVPARKYERQPDYVYKEYIPPWERGLEKKKRERLPPPAKPVKKEKAVKKEKGEVTFAPVVTE